MNNTLEVKNRIEQAFLSLMDDSDVAREIAFHMTDWDNDLEGLNRFYEQPESLSDAEVTALIISLLAHVPNHVAAAKKLVGLGPMEDIFGVGILTEEEDSA
jgi:hypothetical protein